MSESHVDHPARSVRIGRLIGACTIGGVLAGGVLVIAWIVELAERWAIGHTGLLGEEFSMTVTVIFGLGGGAIFGALAGVLAGEGALAGQAISAHWLPSAIGASLGATSVGAVVLLVAIPSEATAPVIALVLTLTASGPFAFVALCARRDARHVSKESPVLTS